LYRRAYGPGKVDAGRSGGLFSFATLKRCVMLVSELFDPDKQPLLLLGSDRAADRERGFQVVDRLLLDPAWLSTWCVYQASLSAGGPPREPAKDVETSSLPCEVERAIVENGVFVSYLDGRVEPGHVETLLRNPRLLKTLHNRILGARPFSPDDWRLTVKEIQRLWDNVSADALAALSIREQHLLVLRFCHGRDKTALAHEFECGTRSVQKLLRQTLRKVGVRLSRPAEVPFRPHEDCPRKGYPGDCTEKRTPLAGLSHEDPLDRVCDRFFEGWSDAKGKVLDRMRKQPYAKAALGSVLLQAVRQRAMKPFVESGSTLALALLALSELYRQGEGALASRRVKTNNLLVQMALYSLTEASPLVLYGDMYFNRKYGGYFPVAEDVICRATAGDAECADEVWNAWARLRQDVRMFDLLFMTASRFSLFCGPFVGSPDNALLKSAFYTGQRVFCLIDGTKIVPNNRLPFEWARPECIPVFAQAFGGFNIRQLSAIYGKNRGGRFADLLDSAAKRNPCVRLGYTDVKVPMAHAARSWAECVETVLSRTDGELAVFVSEPDTEHGGVFERFLRDAVREGSECFARFGCKVRIEPPERSLVKVNPKTCSLLPAGAEAGWAVPVWRCRYVLGSGDEWANEAGGRRACEPVCREGGTAESPGAR